MALKDWKNTEKDYWERPSIKKNIFRGKIGTDKLGIVSAYSDKTEEYTDWATIIMISGGGVKRKQFNTKAQAISYAKAYMKKH